MAQHQQDGALYLNSTKSCQKPADASEAEADNGVGRKLHPLDKIPLSASVQEIQFYWDLVTCNDLAHFMARILRLVNAMGFSDYAFGRLAANGGTEGGLLTTRMEALQSYQSEAFYEHDLIFAHAVVSENPIFQSTIGDYIERIPFKNESMQRNMDLIKMNQSMGYADFYNIPLRSHADDGNVLLSVSSADISRKEFHERVAQRWQQLQLLAQAVDYVGLLHYPEFFYGSRESVDIVISPRPLMLLNTLAKDNVSLKEAADILCISIDTANKHIAAAKKALGANTQAAAVFRAVKEGLISIKK